MSERDTRADDVEREHLAKVSAPAHWAYLVGTLGLGMLAMLLLLALLERG